MKVALVQFDTRSRAKDENLQTIEHLLCGVECDLVVLPEMFATGYEVNSEEIAEPHGGPTLHWMQHLASSKGFAVAGTVATRERKEFFNRMYICLPDGSTFHYDKRHLFTFAGEQEHLVAGRERIIVEWCGVRIAPMICYDLRFPAWSYLPGKADLLLYSASWAASRIGAWDTLLPARAVENQAWVVGVNRVGTDAQGTPYNGHSAAYDYLGNKVATCSEEQGVVVVDINPEKINAFREKFRAWQDADNIEIR